MECQHFCNKNEIKMKLKFYKREPKD